MNFKLSAALVIIILAGLVSVPTAAEWSQDPVVNNPVCTAVEKQEVVRSISDGAGGVILCWMDRRADPMQWDIYAQRLDANGMPLWTADGVPICTAADLQFQVGLVTDGVGGAIIYWGDERDGDSDIYAQRVDADGNTLWTADGLGICTAVESQSTPQAVSDTVGGAIIAWTDRRNGGSPNADVYAQRIDESGASLWTSGGVAVCSNPGSQYGPEIVYKGAGSAVVVWLDESGADLDLYAQHLDRHGNLLWNAAGVAVCTAVDDQEYPAVVSASDGTTIVGWKDLRTNWCAVYAQKLDGSGAGVWTTDGVLIKESTAGTFILIFAVNDDAGGAVISWVNHLESTESDLWAQRINTNGGLRWAADGLLVCGEVGSQSARDMVRDENGGLIITWDDYRDHWSNPDIYAQRLDWFGNEIWAAGGIPLGSATDFQVGGQLVADGNGGAVAAWMDKRSGVEYDIYAQWVDRNGYIGGLDTIDAAMGCLPCSGTVPFSTRFRVTMYNLLDDQFRRAAGRLNIGLANGSLVRNWRAGSTTLSPGEDFNVTWYTTIPAISSVVGQNRFILELEDVTQAPFNQPPYMPSGDTDIAEITITGIAP